MKLLQWVGLIVVLFAMVGCCKSDPLDSENLAYVPLPLTAAEIPLSYFNLRADGWQAYILMFDGEDKAYLVMYKE